MSEQTQWGAGYRVGILKRAIDACPYGVTSARRKPWVEGYRIATEPLRSARGGSVG